MIRLPPTPPRWRGAISSLAVLVIAFAAGGVLVTLSGGHPGKAGAALLYGAFGTPGHVSGVIVKTVPLLLTGLSVAVAFRVGLFNIGGEGQLYAGALAAATLGALDLGLHQVGPELGHDPHVLLGDVGPWASFYLSIGNETIKLDAELVESGVTR